MAKKNIWLYAVATLLILCIFLLQRKDNANNPSFSTVPDPFALPSSSEQAKEVIAANYDEVKTQDSILSGTAINQNAKKYDIFVLTAEKRVVGFLKNSGQLPDCYISKKEARAKGWVATKANMCNVLPGKAIGGDIFSNRERKLPEAKGRIWFEADINYHCGSRNADRVIFSNDHLIYVTYDHYQTFEEK